MRFSAESLDHAVRLLLSVKGDILTKRGCRACEVSTEAADAGVVHYREEWESERGLSRARPVGGVPAGPDRDGHELRGAADRRRKLLRARRDGVSAHAAGAGPGAPVVFAGSPETNARRQ